MFLKINYLAQHFNRKNLSYKNLHKEKLFIQKSSFIRKLPYRKMSEEDFKTNKKLDKAIFLYKNVHEA